MQLRKPLVLTCLLVAGLGALSAQAVSGTGPAGCLAPQQVVVQGVPIQLEADAGGSRYTVVDEGYAYVTVAPPGGFATATYYARGLVLSMYATDQGLGETGVGGVTYPGTSSVTVACDAAGVVCAAWALVTHDLPVQAWTWSGFDRC